MKEHKIYNVPKLIVNTQNIANTINQNFIENNKNKRKKNTC